MPEIFDIFRGHHTQSPIASNDEESQTHHARICTKENLIYQIIIGCLKHGKNIYDEFFSSFWNKSSGIGVVLHGSKSYLMFCDFFCRQKNVIGKMCSF